jgi:RNA-dependent RNA polymerase
VLKNQMRNSSFLISVFQGLLVEDPDIKDESFSIKLRPSLMKIKYESPLDATHRTIDILHIAHARAPARISTDIIINLYENGVKFTSICQLMKRSIDGIVDPLLDWHLDDEDPNTSDNSRASLALWVNYERAGSVIRSRRAREEVALARINGFSGGVLTNESAQELDELEEVLEHSAEWFPDRVSGCPSSLEETIIEFLDSGFHPKTCPMLREKMNQVLHSTVSRAVENYTIELPFSASAWIIPGVSFFFCYFIFSSRA